MQQVHLQELVVQMTQQRDDAMLTRDDLLVQQGKQLASIQESQDRMEISIKELLEKQTPRVVLFEPRPRPLERHVHFEQAPSPRRARSL